MGQASVPCKQLHDIPLQATYKRCVWSHTYETEDDSAENTKDNSNWERNEILARFEAEEAIFTYPRARLIFILHDVHLCVCVGGVRFGQSTATGLVFTIETCYGVVIL